MNNTRRFIAVLFCLTLLTLTVCIPVSASETEVDQAISQMNQKAMYYYRQMSRIACFLAMTSLAFCGYKILGAIFFGNFAGQRSDITKAQKQFVMTIIALLVWVFLPQIIGYVIETLEAKAWKPRTGT